MYYRSLHLNGLQIYEALLKVRKITSAPGCPPGISFAIFRTFNLHTSLIEKHLELQWYIQCLLQAQSIFHCQFAKKEHGRTFKSVNL